MKTKLLMFGMDVERAMMQKKCEESGNYTIRNVYEDKQWFVEYEIFEEVKVINTNKDCTEKPAIQIGTCIEIDNEIYILATLGTNKVLAICLEGTQAGFRMNEGVEVSNRYRISTDEMYEITNGNTYNVLGFGLQGLKK